MMPERWCWKPRKTRSSTDDSHVWASCHARLAEKQSLELALRFHSILCTICCAGEVDANIVLGGPDSFSH